MGRGGTGTAAEYEKRVVATAIFESPAATEQLLAPYNLGNWFQEVRLKPLRLDDGAAAPLTSVSGPGRGRAGVHSSTPSIPW